MDRDAALVAHNALLADAVLGADPALPVAACPGWTVANLLTHVGRGDRWAAEIVRTGAPLAFRDVPGGKPGPDARAWLAESPRLLLDAVDTAVAADPDKQVWTFLGPRPAIWWVRRRLHESTVHLADAVLAAGGTPVLAPDVATDGIDDFLEIVTERSDGDPALDDGVSLHLHATDDPAGEWTVLGNTWEHGHGKGDAAVRGPASALLLAVHRRLPADDAALTIFGDETVWHTFRNRTAF